MTTTLKHHGIIWVVLLLLSTAMVAAGEPGPPTTDNHYPYAKFSPSMAIIIVVLIAALFFMGFFSIYIRHCTESANGGSVQQALSMRARRAAATRGLEASVIETFPTFSYSEVKDHKIGKGALECAVCLNEFEGDETLRLIPKCDHVFHPECIDAWLSSHVTCPVCRANLVPESGENEAAPAGGDARVTDSGDNNREQTDENSANNDVVLQILENPPQDAESSAIRPEIKVKRNSSFEYPNRPPRSLSVRRWPRLEKFRSHSTGHSLVIPGENLDRFTLRLPDHLRKEIILTRTGSFAASSLPRQGSSRRGYRNGGGEGSSRGGRFYRRIEKSDRAAKSDRWAFTMAPAFLTRGLSMKSPKVGAENGEGSTSRGGAKTPPKKLPSFKSCLEPKSTDEAGLVAADSARPPV